jgi:hypothetical protein
MALGEFIYLLNPTPTIFGQPNCSKSPKIISFAANSFQILIDGFK